MSKTYLDRLSELNDKSIWKFTKQDTDFDQAFKAAKLFSNIPDLEKINTEQYFKDNHKSYGIHTNRHRIWVISQLYGFITKTPFYERSGKYSDEKTTDVFEQLNKYPIDSYEYNTIKTEQMLKVKIHAIIDSAKNNEDYNILPVIFIFKVLKILKDKYGFDYLNTDHLLTYVMTVSRYNDLDEVVEYIANGGQPYSDVLTYKDQSRVLTAINKNINLFVINGNRISINPMYEDYFQKYFIDLYDIKDLHDDIESNIGYSEFLYFFQDFSINLIDELESGNNDLKISEDPIVYGVLKPSESTDGDDEREYINIVDSIKEETINDKLAKGAHMIVPTIVAKNKKANRIKINPILGKLAVKKSKYTCEYSEQHTTFVSSRTGKNFMEGHHLIPVSYQKEVWERYGVNIDCVENIISLCPNCHRAIHHSDDNTKTEIIVKLFNSRIEIFKAIGLNISIEDLKAMYDI